MNHSTITNNGCDREDIAAYLDGELAGAELTSFETHLKSCVACAADLRTQRAVRDLDPLLGKNDGRLVRGPRVEQLEQCRWRR